MSEPHETPPVPEILKVSSDKPWWVDVNPERLPFPTSPNDLQDQLKAASTNGAKAAIRSLVDELRNEQAKRSGYSELLAQLIDRLSPEQIKESAAEIRIADQTETAILGRYEESLEREVIGYHPEAGFHFLDVSAKALKAKSATEPMPEHTELS